MPVILDCFLPSVLELSLASFADCASNNFGTIASLDTTFFSVSSLSLKLDPNAPALVVSVSFVWLVKLGFSIMDVKNTARLSRTILGLTLTFFFVSRYSTIWLTTWFVTPSTCVPPLDVQMPFTNDMLNALSAGLSAIAICQRSFGVS